MERRKNKKGQVLREGESERKDGLFQYRYTDRAGKRRYIYAKTLKELRVKEEVVQREIINHVDTVAHISMAEVIDRYFNLHKSSLRSDTRINHERILGQFKDDPFWHREANDITISDAKQWTKELSELGWKYQTINTFLAIIRPAFASACEDNLVVRNPFGFSLSTILKNEQAQRIALTDEQYNSLVEFVRNDSQYRRQVDIIIFLRETGLRIGEICGLTLNDVDFDKNQITINHQLKYNTEEGYHVRVPKTKAGIRTIPLSSAARKSLENVISHRPVFLNERKVDGYSGFVFLTSRGNPQLPDRINSMLRRIVASYNEVHEEKLPHITPHVFRHTFCTHLILSGMDIKSVQYLMGHSTIKMTLEVYAHVNPPVAQDSFRKICG